MIGHPATYSAPVLDVFEQHIPQNARVLDPFAGTGKIHSLGRRSVGVELEPEWAQMSGRTIVGTALCLPFRDETFDVIATSPCYGNRMADHHEAKDKCKKCDGAGAGCKACKDTGLSMRKTYRHQLQRPLSTGSAAGLQWGVEYRTFHISAWNEAHRVLRDGGIFLLNVSNHIRKDEEIPVTKWHIEVLRDLLGLHLIAVFPVKTRRMRVGANSDKRVEFETVCKFWKGV